MQNTDMRTPYDGEAFKQEFDEFFDAKKKRKAPSGVRAKRKGRNLGGAKVKKVDA